MEKNINRKAVIFKDKRTIFFAAQENSIEQNLETLSNAISETISGESAANMTYRSFSDAFIKIAEMSKAERMVWVIDEYPYLAQADRGISSLLQNFLDHQFKDTKLFLILCGSSMSFMENQVLGYQSPLYGRKTAQFKILPFDYLDTGKWFPDYSCEEKALMYGITGGIPMYLEQFSPNLTIKENLLENLFDRNAALFEEPSNLLKQELREPATYNAVITAIASGKTKLSEIASTIGVETGLLSLQQILFDAAWFHPVQDAWEDLKSLGGNTVPVQVRPPAVRESTSNVDYINVWSIFLFHIKYSLMKRASDGERTIGNKITALCF